jgi:hypothetical protein
MGLAWKSIWGWISLDVSDGALHFIRVIKKNFPTAADPDGVVRRKQSGGAKPQAAAMLELLDHFLCGVTVLADDQVHVIGKDRTRIACVLARTNGIGKSICDDLKRILGEFDKLMLEKMPCLFIEGMDISRCGLDFLPTEVKFTQVMQCITTNLSRCASPRIVR